MSFVRYGRQLKFLKVAKDIIYFQKKFNNTNSLKRHHAVHSGVRDFICGICSVGFYRKFNLDTHIKNVHEEIKNYVCDFAGCQKKFGYARLLRDHMSKHHVKEYAEEY